MHSRKKVLVRPDSCENCGCHIPAGHKAVKTYEHKSDPDHAYVAVYCSSRCRREAA